MVKLTQPQIERLSKAFSLDEGEIIVEASYSVFEADEILLVMKLRDKDGLEWNYRPLLEKTSENYAWLRSILTGEQSQKFKPIPGWDCYTHNYEYDEVKVIAMVHEYVTRVDIQTSWESIMTVGHRIWKTYCTQLQKRLNGEKDTSLEAIKDREEEGYVQAYLKRTLKHFIDKHRKTF